MLYNKHRFKGKTVLDIGCGTGILSMLAANAGAAKVIIGIEFSHFAQHSRIIVETNGLSHFITIAKRKVEGGGSRIA